MASDRAAPRARRSRLSTFKAVQGAVRTVPARLLAAVQGSAVRRWREAWHGPRAVALRRRVATWQGEPRSGLVLLVLGTALVTLLVLAIDRLVVSLPDPGVLYLSLIAMLAYHWSWRLGALAGLLQLACVYLLLIAPSSLVVKPLRARGIAELVTLAAVNIFTLLLVQLAHVQRDTATRQAVRSAALNEVGRALASELDEARLLRLIAKTARDLTGAGFAAFTLRPLDAHGQPLVPSEGNLFHLAAVVGVTPEQEALFRRVPLGGEGLLAPIFRNGVPVRVADALSMAHAAHPSVKDQTWSAAAGPGTPQGASPGAARHTQAPVRTGGVRVTRREAARNAATSYAHGQLSAEELHAVGAPRGHPVVRSFLGVPLLDREG